MVDTFGKLVLEQPGTPEQEFELSKASISLGRALTNDIVLNDGRVSRSHVRIECSSAGCTLVDLGSANGTRVNGMRVQTAALQMGDVIGVGGAQIRYEAATPYQDIGMTMIDSEAELDLTLEREALPVSINETSQPHLVIFSQDQSWEVALDKTDRITIGRTDINEVALDQTKVSRQHAEVVRRGNLFILRDLGSTNGTWHKGERVDELILQNGDVFRIGEAQLVFKSGFDEASLTLADEVMAHNKSRNPVVFVPGLMGSQLWLGKERIWPNVKVLFKHPEIMAYNSAVPLEPRGILDEVVIVPNLIKIDQYNRLGDYLIEELGYSRDVDFFEFAYDWRQDVRISARQLGQLIDSIPGVRPVTIIAHSLGTMVSRYYVERLGGKQRVDRLILMGGPHHGAVKATSSLLVAPDVLPFGIMGERLRQLTMTLPSSYQIIPTYACGLDQNGKPINFLEDESWVDEKNLPLLRQAREFRKELGTRSCIPTLSIFGYGIKTISQVNLKRSANGRLSDISLVSMPGGDSTILEKSAVLDGTEIHPVQQYHGSLFVDNDVKMRLKVELTRQLSA